MRQRREKIEGEEKKRVIRVLEGKTAGDEAGTIGS